MLRQSVSLGEPSVAEVVAGLVDLEFELDPAPDADWIDIFVYGEPARGWPLHLHPPKWRQGVIRLHTQERVLQDYFDALRRRVEVANVEYRDQKDEIEKRQEHQRARRVHLDAEARLADEHAKRVWRELPR